MAKPNLTVSLQQLSDKVTAFSSAVDVLLSKWNLAIMYALFLQSGLSFRDLERILNISSRILSDRLKVLQASGLVVRSLVSGPPIRVFYSLSEKGGAVVVLVLPLVDKA